MNIDIVLDHDFTSCLTNLKQKYGERLAELNGFSDSKLDHTSFIDNFIDNTTVADASVDPSSNVGRHDMPTLLGELSKSHKKLLSYNKLYYEIKKKWGIDVADKWLQAEYDGHLYLHDAPSSSFVSYCYKGTQQLYIKYQDVKYSTTFEHLYELVDSEEVIDTSINYPVKYPADLYVFDYDLNSKESCWTRVTRLCKHGNTQNMVFIKLANGLTQIVTDNHPIITDSGDKPASKITKEDKIFSINPTEDIFDQSITSIKVDKSWYPKHSTKKAMNRGIGSFKLTQDLGWLTGMLLSDASFQGTSSITYSQNADSSTFAKFLDVCKKLELDYIVGSELSSNTITVSMKITPYTKWLAHSQLGTNSFTRALPDEYIHYPYEFLDGFIAGMIDGDGSVFGNPCRHGDIFSISEKLIRQCESYLRFRGVFANQVKPELRVKSDDIIKQSKHLYRTRFNLADYEEFFTSIGSIKINGRFVPRIRKRGDFKEKKYQFKYGWVNVLTTEELNREDIVYDMTTDSGHFICNNMLSHNCYAYDLKDLAERGLYFLDDGSFNAQPPQHLETFIDFIKEFVSFACNRTSGAVGLPNLIPYMFYFWKKDCDSGYFIHDELYYAKQQIQRLIYALNQPYTRDGVQSAFTNTSIFDHPYFEALFGGAVFPDGSFMIDYEEEIIKFQKIFLETMSDIRSQNMMTFPVNTISLLYQDGEFVDEEFARYAIEHNRKWADSNLFVDKSVNSLSNCCRLKSDIESLGYFDAQRSYEQKALEEMYQEYQEGKLSFDEFKQRVTDDPELSLKLRQRANRINNDENSLGYQNSIGGSALSVGSVKVSTLNLARIALESKDASEYLEKLKYYVELDCIILDTVRHVIKRNVEKGLLQNFSYGLVDFDHLYNTIGFIGVYETLKHFGYVEVDDFGDSHYTKEGEALGEKIFDIIHSGSKEFIRYYGCDYQINCEQSPAESAADKLMQKDKYFYPDTVIDDLPLYGNQFMPLGIKTSLQERVRIQALFDSFCNGGSILHANIDAPIDSFEKAWKLVHYIADAGVTYFAFNPKIQACEHNHGFYGNKCPVCGGEVATEYTRIVGFFTPINTWAKPRKKEYELRQWANVNI